MALSMRRIIMLAVVSLIMALTVALSGTALAAPGAPPENERALCALAAVSIHFGGGPNPGELFGPGGPCGTK